MATSSFEVIRRSRREQQIEDLLATYPYLIDPRFQRARRQVQLNRKSRADLIFELPQTCVIVEIKRDHITRNTVLQLQTYLRAFQRQTRKKVEGILVGRDIDNAAIRSIGRTSAPIQFRQLDVDIPTTIVVCRQCRSARNAVLSTCPQDGSSAII